MTGLDCLGITVAEHAYNRCLDSAGADCPTFSQSDQDKEWVPPSKKAAPASSSAASFSAVSATTPPSLLSGYTLPIAIGGILLVVYLAVKK